MFTGRQERCVNNSYLPTSKKHALDFPQDSFDMPSAKQHPFQGIYILAYEQSKNLSLNGSVALDLGEVVPSQTLDLKSPLREDVRARVATLTSSEQLENRASNSVVT
jgi:hypothetical protein